MRKTWVLWLIAAWAAAVSGADVGFDGQAVGRAPQGWTCGTTGSGSSVWSVEADPTAPDARQVLKRSGNADFSWCVLDAESFADGVVQVKFKPIAGRDDQAGGLVWRWKDKNNYYVARANAQENNVALYYTEGGRRKTIKYVDAPVAANAWHALRVEFAGTKIRVLLDGQLRIEQDDAHLAGTGKSGVWSKADSVTTFAEFVSAPPGAATAK
jgi:hypothetical protein